MSYQSVKNDPRFDEFLTKMADLMDEYCVTIETTEDTIGYETMATGIDITCDFGKKHEWNGSCYFEIESTYITANDVRFPVSEEQK